MKGLPNRSRRDFIKDSAAVAGFTVFCQGGQLWAQNTSQNTNQQTAQPSDVASVASPMETRRPKFHSRHIPIEHLNTETPMGKDVVRNGLCDAIKPDVLKQLRDLGVDLIETRLAWWEIEPEPGRFYWDRLLRDIDAVQDAGLQSGIFAWLQYPPAWYDPQGEAHARPQALGSGLNASILSFWDPKTLETYDRLLEAIAEKLKGRIQFVYNAISGNYGEVTYELGAKHYKFSSPGSSTDCFLGDRCARASFAKELQQKYGSPDALAKAWDLSIASFNDDLMPKLPFNNAPLRQRDDCVLWATESLMAFADQVCGLYKKHFPGVPGGLPIGFVEENILVGQIKSRAAKLAAKYGLTARWTGCAYLGSFDRSHLLARRIASAAHFYGAPFGTEAALIINAENAANALYESFSNGASLVHDDPQNMLRSLEVQRAMRPKMVVDPPVCSLAAFYPVEDEMLQTEGYSWKQLVSRSASLRQLTDFDVCDGLMIADGYLAQKRDLVFLTHTHLRKETAQAVAQFAATTGRVWLYDDVQVQILHESTSLDDLAGMLGIQKTQNKPEKVGKTGLYRFTDWPELAASVETPPFTLAVKDSAAQDSPCYRTMHHHHESCYFPKEQRFEIAPRTT
jgi:hypothetical protein